MNNYNATEIAYKNGYNQAIKDFLNRMREEVTLSNAWFVDFDDIHQIAKEMEKK